LLTKYQPDDRLVKEVVKQIEDTEASLGEANTSIATEQSSDVNPIRQSVQGELVKAEVNEARYDHSVEEAARDLGASKARTFREVTLPLVWTGIFGAFLFGATLTWNDYDRSILFQVTSTDTLPLTIGGLTFTGAIRPDLYALGTATTLGSILVVLTFLVVASLVVRLRGAGATPVHRVEEEFGEEVGGEMRVEAAGAVEK
jgi:hypothetical protein